MRGPASVAASAQVFVDDLDELVVGAADAHHLSEVLRLRPGEPVVASDGAGNWRLCLYRTPSSPGGAAARILEPHGGVAHEAPRLAPVTVGFAPLKGDRVDWVVQKLTELGVDRILLVRSARAVVRWDAARAARAVERLGRVAREAAAQSRRARIPEVTGLLSLRELATLVAPAPLALAHPGGPSLGPGVSALVVGPEGGWSEEELAEADRLVGLSDGVLRAETAAVVAGMFLCSPRNIGIGGASGFREEEDAKR